LRLPEPPLLVITDRRQARAPLEDVAAAVFAAGGRWLLLREKDLASLERMISPRRRSPVSGPTCRPAPIPSPRADSSGRGP
jgi:thiamine-phosphate pyrophosphorylase